MGLSDDQLGAEGHGATSEVLAGVVELLTSSIDLCHSLQTFTALQDLLLSQDPD